MYPHLVQFETRRVELARELRLLDELAAARAQATNDHACRPPAAPKRYGLGLTRLIRRPLAAG
jgi:hypothetical protein